MWVNWFFLVDCSHGISISGLVGRRQETIMLCNARGLSNVSFILSSPRAHLHQLRERRELLLFSFRCLFQRFQRNFIFYHETNLKRNKTTSKQSMTIMIVQLWMSSFLNWKFQSKMKPQFCECHSDFLEQSVLYISSLWSNLKTKKTSKKPLCFFFRRILHSSH